MRDVSKEIGKAKMTKMRSHLKEPTYQIKLEISVDSECKSLRNRTSVVIKAYEGIPEILTFNIFVSIIFVIIFIFLRYPQHEYHGAFTEEREAPVSFLYNHKALDPLAENRFSFNASPPPSPDPPTGYFGWIKFVIKLTDEEFLKVCGPDAVHYLSFQKHLMVVIVIVMAICLFVILPINFFMGDAYAKVRLGRTTMANLPTDSNWLWIHVVVVILYVPLITFTMQDSSGNKAFEAAAQVRTVFVKNIEVQNRREEKVKANLEKQFPGIKIEKIQMTYKYNKFLKKYKDYEKIRSALDYLDSTHEDLMVKPKICSKKVDAYEYYKNEETKILDKLNQLRSELKLNATGMAFVTVETADNAKYIVKSFKKTKEENWSVSIAPQIEDIEWQNLRLATPSWYLLWIAVNSILFIVLCLLITPTIVLDMLFQQARTSAHGVKLRNLLFQTLLICLFSFLLPHIVLYSDDILRYHTLSKNQFWVMVKIFFYLVIMVLFLPTLGFTSVHNLSASIASGHRLLWECIVRPTRGDFYIKYIISEAFILTSIDLLRLGDLVVYGWERMFMKSKAELPYVKKHIFRLFPYGKNYAWTIFIFSTSIVHSVFCPLIMPAVFLYILTKHFVDRHNIYFGFIPCNMVSYEGRNIHTVAINLTTLSVIVLMLFMAMIFAALYDLIRASFCFILLIIMLIIFPVLMAFRKNPKIQVPPPSKMPVYLPLPLQKSNGEPDF